MRIVLAGCALLLAASLQPASAQIHDGWPWSAYPSLRKQVAPKRAQPRPPAKDPATASLDVQPLPAPIGPKPEAVEPSRTAAPAARPADAAGAPAASAPMPPQPRHLRPGNGASCARPGPSATRRATRSSSSASARAAAARCMPASPAPQSNPLYRASNPAGMHFYADCADLPYMLRAYYAWKNGLPFSYSTAVTPLGLLQGHPLHRARQRHLQPPRPGRCRASMRAAPSRRSSTPSPRRTTAIRPTTPGKLLPDHYPVKIARDSIKPGTIIYDPNGHVAVVYKVTARRPHPLHRHAPRQLAHARHLRQGLHALLARHGRGLQALAPADAGRRHAAPRRQLSRRPDRAQPPTRTSPTGPTSSSSAPSPNAAEALEHGQVRARGRDARILRLRAQAAGQCRASSTTRWRRRARWCARCART